MNRQIKRYGWIPDLPDHRDKYYSLAPDVVLPPQTDLRGLMPPVYDQKDIGSCTGNSTAGALQFDELKDAMSEQDIPSRLWIYYQARLREGTPDQDSGAMLRDCAWVAADIGWVNEHQWPYDPPSFASPPPGLVPIEKALQYFRIDQIENSLKTCLAEGYPFVFGFTVYQSFEGADVAKTGIVPMPTKDEAVLGGHAVMAVGYDDQTRRFTVRNSWGELWGDLGYFYMPYDYLLNPDLAQDFWTFRRVG